MDKRLIILLSTIVILFAVVFIPKETYLSFLVGLYFLPTMVGWKKRNAGAIFVLNLFLGWTFIGWVAALVWALCED